MVGRVHSKRGRTCQRPSNGCPVYGYNHFKQLRCSESEQEHCHEWDKDRDKDRRDKDRRKDRGHTGLFLEQPCMSPVSLFPGLPRSRLLYVPGLACFRTTLYVPGLPPRSPAPGLPPPVTRSRLYVPGLARPGLARRNSALNYGPV